MKLSLNWLSDFVAFREQDPLKIAEKLTLGVAEVERVEVQGELLEHCVVGNVLSVEKHQQADKLFLCDVATERGKKRVVCGGGNLRSGMLVAFAHVGAKVKWHGGEFLTLTKAKIRGEESEGMICAAEELGLEELFPGAVGRNIIDLESDERFAKSGKLKVGLSLREALGLNDVIFHIDNNALTHRPDLFSHVGFARECIALGLGTWRNKPAYTPPRFPKEPLPFRCGVDIKHLVPRYCACLLHIESPGETPVWMVRKLGNVGYRSLNLPIDITNYVAVEVGMPLHSFDADEIQGNVHFRLSRRGERMTTLDGVERELPDKAIVLSDNAGIFDLMGVMGGLRSSTKETTRNIYLHAAIVDPTSIRRTVTVMGHRTEASTVYEKGVPRIAAKQGLFRAVELFLMLVPGARIASVFESYGDDGTAKPIPLSLERASRALGRPVSVQEATKALTSLGFVVNQKPAMGRVKRPVGRHAAFTGKKLAVRTPLHRLGDIHGEADLIEEIARITGFETYREELPSAPLAVPPNDDRLHRLRGLLKEMGYGELVRFAFLGDTLMKKAGMTPVGLREVANPLSKDLTYLRSSLRPRLLEYAEENIGFASTPLRLFEIGRVFKEQREYLHLTLLVASKHETGIKGEPFLLTKSATTRLLSIVGVFPLWKQASDGCGPYVHPARRLEFSVGGTRVGAVYEVHPLICRNFDLPHRVAIATLDLTTLLARPGAEKIYQDIPLFPEINYDITISVGARTSVASLLAKVRGSPAPLRGIQLIDVFEKGRERHLTFRCTYGAPDRTLTEEEAKPVHEQVEAILRG